MKFETKTVFLSLHQKVVISAITRKNMFSHVFNSEKVFLNLRENLFNLGLNHLTNLGFLLNYAANFMLFSPFFSFFLLKMQISTSVWSAQHPNAGWRLRTWKKSAKKDMKKIGRLLF